ncbi:MAG: anti-sigma factor antagonist [Spirochaetes bacterium]|nr:MAG: anti-sigma factor antagonist [Spirochaetota bacterium]
MNGHTTWSFPREIEFEDATQLSRRIRELSVIENTVVFDLSATKHIHSSFVGFLIHTKQYLEAQGMHLILKTSPQIDKILAMLDLASYFPIVTAPAAPEKEPLLQ